MKKIKEILKFTWAIITFPYILYCVLRAFKEHDDIMMDLYLDDNYFNS